MTAATREVGIEVEDSQRKYNSRRLRSFWIFERYNRRIPAVANKHQATRENHHIFDCDFQRATPKLRTQSH
jgi:hypothetical protein